MTPLLLPLLMISSMAPATAAAISGESIKSDTVKPDIEDIIVTARRRREKLKTYPRP